MLTSDRPAQPWIAPQLPAGEWLNGPAVDLTTLRERVVVLYFWHYASLPALHLLAELHRWERRYAGTALRFVGVHLPHFAFERETAQIAQALADLGLMHPTLLDHEAEAARAFNLPVLPWVYLIDARGQIVDQGAAPLGALERTLARLLIESSRADALPPAPERALDLQELPVGASVGALGNVEGYAVHAPILYRLPRQRSIGHFYIEGAWRAAEQHITYEGTTEGTIYIPYRAVEVYAVLSPYHQLIDRLLHPEPTALEVWLDGRPLDEAQRGDDLTADGRVLVDRPRIYHLIRGGARETHELTLRVRTGGFSVYGFTLCGTGQRETS